MFTGRLCDGDQLYGELGGALRKGSDRPSAAADVMCAVHGTNPAGHVPDGCGDFSRPG